MHGIGNDFVMINRFSASLVEAEISSLALQLCDRRRGIGADGLVTLDRGETLPWRMRMWNPDGTESAMCGNALRCLAVFLRDEGLDSSDRLAVEIGGREVALEVLADHRVCAEMGAVEFASEATILERAGGIWSETSSPPEGGTQGGREAGGAPGSGLASGRAADSPVWNTLRVSVGNPHWVLVGPDPENMPLDQWGPELENFGSSSNVHFVQILGSDRIKVRTWERGAGLTLACGSGACACAAATHQLGLTTSKVEVLLPGGSLFIEISDSRARMTGPAQTVFRGHWYKEAAE